jgi:Zn finger protein HypA/HybF involved in hydrogenase expression
MKEDDDICTGCGMTDEDCDCSRTEPVPVRSESAGWEAKCTECNAVFDSEKTKSAQNPFRTWETIYGCPACGSIETFIPND